MHMHNQHKRSSSCASIIPESAPSDIFVSMHLLPLLLFFLQPLVFERREIDPNPPKNPWIKLAADLDGDRKTDVIIGGSKGPLVWYVNGSWSKSLITEGGYNTVDAEAADIDRDGDLDIVAGGLLWYENPGAGSPWKAHRISTHATHDVEVGDLNRDGRLDIVVRGQTAFKSQEGKRIVIWKQLSPDAWESREIPCPAGEGLKLLDMDRDGDLDIVIASLWFENAGDWQAHTYTSRWTHPHTKLESADFNRDGRPDLVITPAELKGDFYKVAWYEAPRNARTAEWTEHIVVERIEAVLHSLAAGDVDGDRAPDIATAIMHQGSPPNEVILFLNRGKGARWEKAVLSERGSHDVRLADLDGDGVLDLMGANHSGPFQPVEWWRLSRRR
jgi:hypothetical protein